MQQAGYQTMYAGKYMNMYGLPAAGGVEQVFRKYLIHNIFVVVLICYTLEHIFKIILVIQFRFRQDGTSGRGWWVTASTTTTH